MDANTPAETVIRIVLPGQPRAWQRDGRRIVTPKDKTKRQFGGTYTHTETRHEQAALKLLAAQVMDGRPPFEGPMELRYGAFFSIPESWSGAKQRRALADEIRPVVRPDFDNLLKQVDAFKNIVWRDDWQATDVFFWKRYSDRPRVVIEIRPINLAKQGVFT